MYIFLILLFLILFVIVFLYINYKVIFVSKYVVKNSKLPKIFHNFKILHLSDWHCTYYGKDNIRLVNLINKQDVDIIVITGDFVVRQRKEIQPVFDFIDKINNKPIYYSLGNHELVLPKELLRDLIRGLKKRKVKVLYNDHTMIARGKEQIGIYGLTYCTNTNDSRAKMKNELITRRAKQYNNKFNGVDKRYFNILLSHDPLYFAVYARMKFDLVYSGHLHGGGIRLFGFGLATPRKKWTFTRLAAGKKELDGTTMIVSRGVGNSTYPVRFFNPPEISVTTLKAE